MEGGVLHCVLASGRGAAACWAYLTSSAAITLPAFLLRSRVSGRDVSFISANGVQEALSYLLVLPDCVVAAVIKGGHACDRCVLRGVLQTRGSRSAN